MKQLVMTGVLLASLFVSSRAEATGFGDGMEPGADIMIKEMRWPIFDKGTYFCIWYNKFIPNGYTTFYGGVVTKGADKSPGMFMTYWNDLENVHNGPLFYRKGYGAEGAKGGAAGDAVFMKPNQWVRFVMRIYPSPDEKENASYIGWWVKDLKENKWHTHSVVKIPMRETGFSPNGGFAEALAPRELPRQMDRRLGYYRKDGKWKPSYLTAHHKGRFQLAENDTIVHFQTPLKNDPKPLPKAHTFVTKQPAAPQLDAPAIKEIEAYVFGEEIAVQWSLPQGSSPQLKYKIEAFSNAKATGDPIAVDEATGPQVYAKRLVCGGAAKSVRVTVMDIFDQEVSKTIAVTSAAKASKGIAVEGPAQGLEYKYYEAAEEVDWLKLPDFKAMTPKHRGYVKALDDSVRQGRHTQYAIQYEGYLNVTKTGLYVIELGTSDGSRLSIDGKLLANNDGVHSTTVGRYPICMEKGLHKIALDYFKGARRVEGQKLILAWEGPDFSRRDMVTTDFFCKTTGRIPDLVLSIKNETDAKGVLVDNLLTVEATVKTGGHRIDRIQYFYGGNLLGSKEVTGDGAIVLTKLAPQGRDKITARLWYNNNRSVNGNALTVTARNIVGEDWKFTNIGQEKFPMGVRFKGGVLSFSGEGTSFGYKTAAGDFTFTARIKEIDESSAENGIASHNWIGLYVQNRDPATRGALPHGILLTSGKDIRGTKDFPDLAGTDMSTAAYATRDHRWLKLIHRGQHYESFVSKDGKDWIKIDERVSRRFGGKAWVGVHFRSVPGKNRTFFNASVDNITLVGNAPPRVALNKPEAKNFSLTNRITALVQSSDGKVIVARGSGGLLLSSDDGKSWKPINGDLKGHALGVRSVAIDPTNSSIMLRAGGRVVDGELVSGLWKTEDAGKSWRLTTKEIDFDAHGPTTFFGEVIRYNPNNPKQVIAAGETKGLFVSWDAGETWSYVKNKGERITAVAFHNELQKRGDRRYTMFIFTTWDDSQFKALGLPQPATPLNNPGRIYLGGFDADEPQKKRMDVRMSIELPGVGFTNVLYDTHSNFADATSTRGLYYTWAGATILAQRRNTMPADQLMIALGSRKFSGWTNMIHTGPFADSTQGPVFESHDRSRIWRGLQPRPKLLGAASGVSLSDGVTSILPDIKDDKVVYFCNRHGVFKSSDGGKSYTLICKGS